MSDEYYGFEDVGEIDSIHEQARLLAMRRADYDDDDDDDDDN